ncbi:MAG: hypothetical protein P0Y48_04510 [Candidatus Microbacterium phytovorans]|uniref:Uncharacterized protein n=1 Tax=Candidatus Microbacterium phytovorans TaxID=3121374 RepID=A0AAJ5W1P3_9MICO|nr:hypothetical protein [Microbacterium sp.]WEK14471.1 MAG: hypothetical protein P0Y48_04510 [Microbacterium sp.]
MTKLATMLQNADTANTPKDAPLDEAAEAQLQAILTAERLTVRSTTSASRERKRFGPVLAWIAVPALAVGVIAAVSFGQEPARQADPTTAPGHHTESPGQGDRGAHTDEPTTEAPTSDTPPDVTFEASWAFDVADVNEIRAHADAIVDADVVSISRRAVFVFPGNPMPYTEVQLRVHDILKGSAFGTRTLVTVLYPGGTVTLQQVLDAYPRESTEKRGLTKLSEEELDRQTETYGYDDTTLVSGERYVLALGVNEDTYTVGPAGFGVFHVDGDVLTNAITGSRYTYADFQEE